MNEEKCKYYRDTPRFKGGCSNMKYRGISCASNPNCYYKQLQTAKEENEKLKKIVDIAMKMKATWDEFDKVNEEELGKLTQQNKQMRESLEKIDKEFPIDDNLIFSNNLEKLCKLLFRIRDIAQQALKGVE